MSGRIAVLSDIHGNARALDAVLADVDCRGISELINLGDCAYGPFDPTAALKRLIECAIPTVSGNEDHVFAEALPREGLSKTARFTQRYLTQQHVEWLAALPLRIERAKLIAFHACPDARTSYLLIRPTTDGGVRAATQDEIGLQLTSVSQGLILCGHDHMPRTLTLMDGRVIVNPGSVGCPAYRDDTPVNHIIEMGSPHARYAVIEMTDGAIRTELISVTYDWSVAADEAAANGFPDWAQWIATGRC